MKSAQARRIELILCFHSALLGCITDNLYAVTGSISDDEKRLTVVAYYLGDPYADDEWEVLSVGLTEVIGNYAVEDFRADERYVDVRVEPLPEARRGDLMFLRCVRGMWPNFDE